MDPATTKPCMDPACDTLTVIGARSSSTRRATAALCEPPLSAPLHGLTHAHAPSAEDPPARRGWPVLACWSADPNRPDSSQWTPIHRGESPPPSPFPSHRSVPPASSAPCLPRAPFRAPHTQRTSRRGFNQGRPADRPRESPVFFDTTEPPDQSRGPPPPSPSRPSLPHSTASLTRTSSARSRDPAGTARVARAGPLVG